MATEAYPQEFGPGTSLSHTLVYTGLNLTLYSERRGRGGNGVRGGWLEWKGAIKGTAVSTSRLRPRPAIQHVTRAATALTHTRRFGAEDGRAWCLQCVNHAYCHTYFS